MFALLRDWTLGRNCSIRARNSAVRLDSRCLMPKVSHKPARNAELRFKMRVRVATDIGAAPHKSDMRRRAKTNLYCKSCSHILVVLFVSACRLTPFFGNTMMRSHIILGIARGGNKATGGHVRKVEI